MQSSLPKRPSIPTGELPSFVDSVLDQGRPPKFSEADLTETPRVTDPVERLKQLIRKARS